MAKYLAAVVMEAREAAGRQPFHIAAAQPGERSVDPSTVYRFEHKQRWPRNPDLLINLYAADLDIAPIELWSRALDLWRADEEGLSVHPQGGHPPGGEAPEVVADVVDRLEEAAGSRPRRARDQRKNPPAAGRRRNA